MTPTFIGRSSNGKAANNKRHLLSAILSMATLSANIAAGCNTAAVGCTNGDYDAAPPSHSEDAAQGNLCLSLSRLETEEELVRDKDLCPTIFSFYQDRLYDDNSGNISGPGCFEDLGCPGAQLECPYARFGGEENCSQENVRDCVLFLRDASNLGYGLDDIEIHLQCNCRC